MLLDNVSDTDLIVPTLINNAAIFPLWAADFFFVAIVAAAMSSIDSVLLVAASTGYKNLLAPFTQAQRTFVVDTLAGGRFRAYSGVGGVRPSRRYSADHHLFWQLVRGVFFPAVVLGLYWSKGHAEAVLGSMVAGTVMLLLWLALQLNSLLHEVFPALALSLLTYIVLSQLREAANPRSLAGDG